jgi:hypothetical protein
MWKSVKLRVLDLNGEVNLDSSDRPVDARGDDEAVERTAAHMLECRDLFIAKSWIVSAKYAVTRNQHQEQEV